MDTNLYDFLRRLHTFASRPDGSWSPTHRLMISSLEFEWLATYLRNPGTVIEFRSRETGRIINLQPNEALVSDGLMLAQRQAPELEKHFSIAGDPQEVFALLYEAMMLNPLMAEVMIGAARAYKEASPLCRACSQRHPGQPITDCPDLENPSWEFKERIK